MHDEHYSPFKGSPDRPACETITVFMLARFRGDQTDSMRGTLRTDSHGFEAVYMPNGELYRSQWFAAETAARADLATSQAALAAAGWTPVPCQ
jgi:hypothetical protein